MSTIRNSVMLIGYPTKPRVNSRESTASFHIDVTMNDRCGGTETFFCIAYGNKAKLVARKVKEAKQLAISGRLHVFKYTDSKGDAQEKVQIVVEDLFIIDKIEEEE